MTFPPASQSGRKVIYKLQAISCLQNTLPSRHMDEAHPVNPVSLVNPVKNRFFN